MQVAKIMISGSPLSSLPTKTVSFLDDIHKDSEVTTPCPCVHVIMQGR